MDDIEMHGVSESGTAFYITPLHPDTLNDLLDERDLGGESGHYLCADLAAGFSVLAKFPDIYAAREVFALMNRKDNRCTTHQ